MEGKRHMIGHGGEKTYDWGWRGKDISLGMERKRHNWGWRGKDISLGMERKIHNWGWRGKDIIGDGEEKT